MLPGNISTGSLKAVGAMLRLCRKRLLSLAGKNAYLVKFTFGLAIIGKAAFYLWVMYAAAGAIWGGSKGGGNDVDCEDFAKRQFE